MNNKIYFSLATACALFKSTLCYGVSPNVAPPIWVGGAPRLATFNPNTVCLDRWKLEKSPNQDPGPWFKQCRLEEGSRLHVVNFENTISEHQDRARALFSGTMALPIAKEQLDLIGDRWVAHRRVLDAAKADGIISLEEIRAITNASSAYQATVVQAEAIATMAGKYDAKVAAAGITERPQGWPTSLQQAMEDKRKSGSLNVAAAPAGERVGPRKPMRALASTYVDVKPGLTVAKPVAHDFAVSNPQTDPGIRRRLQKDEPKKPSSHPGKKSLVGGRVMYDTMPAIPDNYEVWLQQGSVQGLLTHESRFKHMYRGLVQRFTNQKRGDLPGYAYDTLNDLQKRKLVALSSLLAVKDSINAEFVKGKKDLDRAFAREEITQANYDKALELMEELKDDAFNDVNLTPEKAQEIRQKLGQETKSRTMFDYEVFENQFESYGAAEVANGVGPGYDPEARDDAYVFEEKLIFTKMDLCMNTEAMSNDEAKLILKALIDNRSQETAFVRQNWAEGKDPVLTQQQLTSLKAKLEEIREQGEAKCGPF